MTMIHLFLTCANNDEADKISNALLDKHLVVCVKKSSVSSKFLWQGKKSSAEEVILLMDSEKRLFKQIEKEVKTLHSYQAPVLTSVFVDHFSEGISNWLKNELIE